MSRNPSATATQPTVAETSLYSKQSGVLGSDQQSAVSSQPTAEEKARRGAMERAEYLRVRRQTGAMGGRPAKLTLPLVKVIAKDIGFGMTHRAACARHGVNYETWQTALKRKPTFELAVEQHSADWLYSALQIIQLDLPGAVGHRWLAERRFSEFRKADTDVQVHQVTHVHQTPEFQQEVAAYARRLDHGLKGGGK